MPSKNAVRKKLVRTMTFVFGVLCAAAGVLGLVVGGLASTSASARLGFLATGASFLLVALPALALPFSSRLAKWLATAVLGLFAFAMLWVGLAWSASSGSLVFRVAAVGFALLLALRGGLAIRHQRIAKLVASLPQ